MMSHVTPANYVGIADERNATRRGPSSTSLEECTDDEEVATTDETSANADAADRTDPSNVVGLRRVRRELCLIELCWPRASEDARLLPDTYRCVGHKERLLLWYSENFRRQFHARYTDRRPLLLARENECNVQEKRYATMTGHGGG